jgi:hypothetical protein
MKALKLLIVLFSITAIASPVPTPDKKAEKAAKVRAGKTWCIGVSRASKTNASII